MLPIGNMNWTSEMGLGRKSAKTIGSHSMPGTQMAQLT